MADDRRPRPERRSGPPRRAEDLVDWRLDDLETGVYALEQAVEAMKAATSTDRLDRHYVRRDEVRAGRRESRDWTLRIIGVLIAAGQVATALIAAHPH